MFAFGDFLEGIDALLARGCAEGVLDIGRAGMVDAGDERENAILAGVAVASGITKGERVGLECTSGRPEVWNGILETVEFGLLTMRQRLVDFRDGTRVRVGHGEERSLRNNEVSHLEGS